MHSCFFAAVMSAECLTVRQNKRDLAKEKRWRMLQELQMQKGSWCCRGCVTCLKLSPNLRKVSKTADDKQKVEDLEVTLLLKHDVIWVFVAVW